MFRRYLSLITVISLGCIWFAGCKKPEAVATSRRITLTNELADDLQRINSKGDLDSQKPALEKLGTELNNVADPSADTSSKPDLNTANARVNTEFARLAKTIGPTAPLEILNDMGMRPTAFATR